MSTDELINALDCYKEEKKKTSQLILSLVSVAPRSHHPFWDKGESRCAGALLNPALTYISGKAGLGMELSWEDSPNSIKYGMINLAEGKWKGCTNLTVSIMNVVMTQLLSDIWFPVLWQHPVVQYIMCVSVC